MTIERVIEIVEDETGEKVTPETALDSLGMDSLDFLELLVRLGVPNEAAPGINTVNDLYLASQS